MTPDEEVNLRDDLTELRVLLTRIESELGQSNRRLLRIQDWAHELWGKSSRFRDQIDAIVRRVDEDSEAFFKNLRAQRGTPHR